jgi:FtsP/CotA-like multicopper oxidase with cupredoxin domain
VHAVNRHRTLRSGGLVAVALALAACGGGTAPATPPITPGASATPREVNIVMRDYGYVPPVVDLVPGETVTLHVVNGGLEIHEAVVGDLESQLAWEAAEDAVADHPPGPTPVVAEPAGFTGTRIVVGSGQRLDVTWTVPADADAAPGGWFVGCHIPGHWQKGMVVPVQFVAPGGAPIGTPPALPGAIGEPS